MILTGWMRTTEGKKQPVKLGGYEGPDDLPSARVAVIQGYPRVATVMFLVPKQPQEIDIESI